MTVSDGVNESGFDAGCRNHKDSEKCDCDQEEPMIGGKDTCTPKHLQDINKYPEQPKTYMTREDVYKLIDGERDYQKKKQARWDDSKWSISDWVVFIKRYIQKIDDWTGHPREQMDEMRKVAGLAVACMEFNRTRPRNGKFSS